MKKRYAIWQASVSVGDTTAESRDLLDAYRPHWMIINYHDVRGSITCLNNQFDDNMQQAR